MAGILLDRNAVNSMACMQVRLQGSYDPYEQYAEHHRVAVINTPSSAAMHTHIRMATSLSGVTWYSLCVLSHASGRLLQLLLCDLTGSRADSTVLNYNWNSGV